MKCYLPSRFRHVDQRAFTLIELLVVIAIIAILGLAFTLYTSESGGRFPSTSLGNAGADELYSGDIWGGKRGVDLTGDPILDYSNRLINPYLSTSAQVATNSSGAMLVFKCPADTGARPAAYIERLPTVFDHTGWSYLYNAAANGGFGGLGLWNKKEANIVHPTKVILVNDFSFNCFYGNTRPFEYMYWHKKDVLGWGQVMFVDQHVEYLRAFVNKPSFMDGPTWTFIYQN